MTDKELKITGWVLAVGLIAIVLFMGWVIWAEATSEKIILNRADWECIEERRELRPVGTKPPVMVPFQACVVLKRR